MPRTLRLHVLGPFEGQWSDGEVVEVASKKIQGLLGYLAAEGGRGHSRERLATLLWSETGDERARHNLRQALSKIRRQLGPVIKSTGETVELERSFCDSDIAEFETRLPRSDIANMEACLDLYRGDLLESLSLREAPYDEWLLAARRRLNQLACELIHRLATAYTENDQLDDAVAVLRRRLSMDAACEPAHRDLMKILARQGRRSDALRQYESCVEALARELGAEPGSETRATYDDIRAVPTGGEEGTSVRMPSPTEPTAVEDADRPAVAVLPFDNLSSPDEAYFADGIAEDIITALSHFATLAVIARGSTFAYRGREVSDLQISSELGAQFLVRGSVRRAGNRVRINVQLIDAHAGSNVWARRFDREVEDVFLVQDDVTSTVVSTLAGRVEAVRLARTRRAPPERLHAYDFFLRGKEHHHRYTKEDCEKALEMFGRSIQSDPSYAAAHAWYACALGQAAALGLDETDTLVAQAQAAAERGLELDDQDSECHRILAQVYLLRHDLRRAIQHQERALYLNPNDDRSVCAMGEILSFAGRAEEAEAWVRKAIRLNPFHPPRYWSHLARPLFHLGRHAEAVEALEQIREPRVRDLVFLVAATQRARMDDALAHSLDRLRSASPSFDAEVLVGALPYDDSAARQELLDALREAGL